MKTLTLIFPFVCFLFTGYGAYSQPGWTQRNPKPGSLTYFDLHMVNTQQGVARTGLNKLVVTINGGLDWHYRRFHPDSTKTTNHMTFSSPLVGYIAVDDAPVHKTTDGGLTWANTGAGNNLDYLHFESDMVGYAIQGSNGIAAATFFKTTDGGQTWQQSGSLPMTAGLIPKLTTREPGELWLMMNPYNTGLDPNRTHPHRSLDGGQTWTVVPITTPRQVRVIRWFDAQHGFMAMDSNYVGRTVDGGITWTYQTLFWYGSGSDFFFGQDANHVHLLTDQGYVWRSEDGGQNWSWGPHAMSPNPQRAFSLAFTDNETAWAVGESGLISKTTNAGSIPATWKLQAKGPIDEIFSSCLQGSTRAWVTGRNKLCRVSNDNGLTWDHVEVDTAGNYDVNDLQFISPQIGFAASSQGISKTTDGGNSWVVKVNHWTIGGVISQIKFLTPDLGWAVGEYGSFVRTTDGGESWQIVYEQTNNSPFRLNNRIHFINENIGFWIHTSDANITSVWKTTNGGAGWFVLQGSLSGSIGFDVYFSDENNGIIAHGNQPMLTTDGGASWQASQSSVSLRQLRFINSNTGFGVGFGESGKGIYKTENKGQTWSIFYRFPPDYVQLNTLLLKDQSPIVAAGHGGSIHTFDGWTGSPGYIASGRVVKNVDFDCVQDSNESGLPLRILMAEPGPYFATTNSSGTFQMRVDQGQFSLRQVSSSPIIAQIETQICPPGSAPISLSINGLLDTLAGNNFINEIKQCPVLTIGQYLSPHRPCRRGFLQVKIQNQGNISSDTEYVHIKLPHNLHFVSASDIYDYNATDSTYRFKIQALQPGESILISISDSVSCLPNILTGQTLCIKATIPNVPPCLLQSPNWDGADLEVASLCLPSGQTRFRIKNKGAAMGQAAQYRIYIDSALVYQAPFQLAANNTMSVTLPASAPSGFVRMVVPQSFSHPLSTFASAEANCATGLSTNGLFPPPDESPLVDIECVTVTNAYDPNDKLVYPRGWGSNGNVEPGTEFKYTIRFQNTGTDTAFKVVLVDTLDENLDIASFQLGNASHNYNFKVSGKGRPVLTWTFDNILLPDSGRNQEASNGFVSFSIRPKTTAGVGTRLENFADIYFDFNDPIRTNTTVNTLWVPTLDPGVLDTVFTAAQKVVFQGNLQIHPNPSKGQVELTTSTSGVLSIIDLRGLVREQRQVEPGLNALNLSRLPKGVYFIRVETGKGSFRQKLILD